MTDTAQPAVEQLLDDWLEGAWNEVDGPPQDQDQADKLLHALRAVQRRQGEVDQLVARRIDELVTFRNQQTDQLAARASHLEGLLAGWTRAQFERTGRKTFKLTAGELRARARRPRTELNPAMPKDEIIGSVQALTGPGMLPEGAIKVERSVRLGVVAGNTEPGEIVEGYDAPDGYEARHAVGTFDFGSPEPVKRVVPGVVLLVPKDGPEGMQFTAVPS